MTAYSRRTVLQGSLALAAAAALVNLPQEAALGATMPAFADVTTFGAKADGMSDNAPAIRAAWRSGAKMLLLPPGVLMINSKLDLPPGVSLAGSGKYATILSKGFAGDAIVLNSETGLFNLRVEGNGTSRSGAGVVVPDNSGGQTVQNVVLSNSQGPSLYFAGLGAGSRSKFTGLEVRRVGADPGSGRFNVVMASGFQDAAVPRSFWGVETNGQDAFDFGGCNGVFVNGSFLGPVKFTPNSRDVNIGQTRLANAASLTVDGHQVTITGCDISPQITIARGADWISIVANSHNRLPVVNNSGNNRCLVIHPGRSA